MRSFLLPRLIVTLRAASLWAALALPLAAATPPDAPPAYDRGAAIAAELHRTHSGAVLVAAHRADWRDHPENSLPAIRSALALGVEIIEIDVRRTRDARFVVIHDTTLDRTTTGRGRVADFSLEELRALRLRDGLGSPTQELIPTLEEALATIRGRALVNLDKSADHPAEVFAIVAQQHALEFVLFSITQTLPDFEAAYPGLLDQMPHVMLVAGEKTKDPVGLIGPYLERRKIDVLQIVFAQEDSPLLEWIAPARAKGVSIWINALWPQHNAGHDDQRALREPNAAYGWLIKRGADIIQTDRPRLLLDYLRENGHLR